MTDSNSIAELLVRPVCAADLPELVALCEEHAAYEKSDFERDGLEERLRATLLSAGARAHCLVAEGAGQLAGFGVVSEEYSTWHGRCYFHMDCLYLRPVARGGGLGRRIMAGLARIALDAGAVQMQWQTPEWNGDAARFYRRLEAVEAEKKRYTLEGEALRTLASWAEPGEAGRHREREIGLLRLGSHSGWAVKEYGVRFHAEPIAEVVVDAASGVCADYFGANPVSEGKPALGFSVLHHGMDAVWLLVCRWEEEILYQRTLRASLEQPTVFEHLVDEPPMGCVWELKVHEHERAALIKYVLDPVDGPDVDAWKADDVTVLAT